MSQPLRVAVLGCGYWSGFQIPAWQSLGVQVVGCWNRTRTRADAAAAKWGIPRVFNTPEELFAWGQFDIADIIADVDAHESLTLMAAAHHKDVICQKPMSATLESCERMVRTCRQAGVWYAVHENFRWQPPLSAVSRVLDEGTLGRILRAHVALKSPDRDIMTKQPALTRMDHMALRDMGPHIFDVVRRWFGEARALYSLPVSSYADIPVQDTAMTLLDMAGGFPVQADLCHRWEYRMFAEGEDGTLLLDRDNVLHIHDAAGRRSVDTKTWQYLPYIPQDDWAVHGGHVFASIPACLRELKESYMAGRPSATSGQDNLESVRLVFAAIRSWDENRSVKIDEMRSAT